MFGRGHSPKRGSNIFTWLWRKASWRKWHLNLNPWDIVFEDGSGGYGRCFRQTTTTKQKQKQKILTLINWKPRAHRVSTVLGPTWVTAIAFLDYNPLFAFLSVYNTLNFFQNGEVSFMFLFSESNRISDTERLSKWWRMKDKLQGVCRGYKVNLVWQESEDLVEKKWDLMLER